MGLWSLVWIYAPCGILLLLRGRIRPLTSDNHLVIILFMDITNAAAEARTMIDSLRAKWQSLTAAGKFSKARKVAEKLEFWTNKAAFLSQAVR